MLQTTMFIGPTQAPFNSPKREQLTMIKLTEKEIDRVTHVFAYGPVTFKEIDKGLIEAGILEQDPEDKCVSVTGKGWGASRNFYAPDGSVREFLRADAKYDPDNLKENYHRALADNNNQKIVMQELQNALIGLLKNPNDGNAKYYAEQALYKWP